MAENEGTKLSFSDIEDNQIVIPVNAAIRIFYFIDRDDLENCKLVCKTWKKVVDYGDKQLPKRSIDALILSTIHEYSISFYHGDEKRSYFYRKYFVDRDIDEMEIKQRQRPLAPFDETKYRFPCGDRYPRVTANKVFKQSDNFHHEVCKNLRPTIYRHNRPYTRKLFTPPLAYYERLSKMLAKSKVKRLVFHGFTFTDLFVEKILEYVREPLSNIDEVVLHGCNFRYISPQSLHTMLDMFQANAYFIDQTRFCLPSHISAPLLEKPSIQMATIFSVGHCFERHTGGPVTFPIDDDIFLNFAKTLTKIGRIERQFFGIALCRVTQKLIGQYERLVQTENRVQSHTLLMRTNEQDDQNMNGHWLYKHLLFGEWRYRI